MAGGNLELFKFGFYVAFPIWSMYYFGSYDFWEKHVKDLHFWPAEEKTNRLPVEREDIRAALEDLKRDRLEQQYRRRLVKQQADTGDRDT
ncbi:hypothetical protein PYCC9005_002939 [Savitreella phatthalungensis]